LLLKTLLLKTLLLKTLLLKRFALAWRTLGQAVFTFVIVPA
jgi:hypothetical protein